MQDKISAVGATRYTIGLSQILRISPLPNQVVTSLKYASGGSIEIVNPILSGSSTAAASGWGAGYLLGSTEVFTVQGPATFYLAASGATALVAAAIGQTAGATLL